jgi:hypothetical protein
MSANLNTDLLFCTYCHSTQDAEREFFEDMQDRIYNEIQNLEIEVEEHECLDEFACKECGDLHLEILKQYVKIQLNIEHYDRQTFLCDLHRNNIHGLTQEDDDPMAFVASGCCNACPIHCDEWD